MNLAEPVKGFPVVFSTGDPHGIGPEVILKALSQFPTIHPIIFGGFLWMMNIERKSKAPLPISRM